jgi:hypothetical protein
MASAIRKFVVPTIISQLVALLIVVQAVFALNWAGFGAINPITGYTAAYTYDSMVDEHGVMFDYGPR